MYFEADQASGTNSLDAFFFQTDLFGLAGTLHVLLFGQYMKVYQEQGEWRITQSVNR